MFEDSTFESTGRIKTRSRRWMFAALGLNGSILVTLVLVPLIYPEALPSHFIPPLLVVPAAPQPETPQPVRVRAAAPHDYSEMMGRQLIAPRRIPIGIQKSDDPEPAFVSNLADLGPSVPVGDGSPFGIGRSAPIVRPPSPSSVRLPSKFVEGFLIHKSIPQYPAIAKAAHKNGTILRDEAIRLGHLSPAEFDRLVRPEKMIRPS